MGAAFIVCGHLDEHALVRDAQLADNELLTADRRRVRKQTLEDLPSWQRPAWARPIEEQRAAEEAENRALLAREEGRGRNELGPRYHDALKRLAAEYDGLPEGLTLVQAIADRVLQQLSQDAA
jgi:hypothetical protein